MTKTEAQYTDQEDLLATGEEFQLDDTEIPRTGYTPTLPGVYLNPSRILKPANGGLGAEDYIKRQVNGEFGVNFKLVGGLVVNGQLTDTRYPFGKYINTGLRVVMDFSKRPPEPRPLRDESGRIVIDPETGKPKPLRASEINRYLRSAGVAPKGLGLKPTAEGWKGPLLDAIMSTLDTAIGVRIDWHEQVAKAEDGTWPDPVLRSYDFRRRDAEGNIVNTPDGLPIYEAEIVGFLEEHVGQRSGRPYKKFVPDPSGLTFKARAFVSYFTNPPTG